LRLQLGRPHQITGDGRDGEGRVIADLAVLIPPNACYGSSRCPGPGALGKTGMTSANDDRL
jgi:hypothetical protein